MEDNMQRCKICTLPITWETIYFDEEGICNICRNWEIKQKKINWEQREKDLIEILEDVKDNKKGRIILMIV